MSIKLPTNRERSLPAGSGTHEIGAKDPTRKDELEGQFCRRNTEHNARTQKPIEQPKRRCGSGRERQPEIGCRLTCANSGGISTMVIARKLMKVTLLTAYFGLFGMLLVAAGDFVLHG